MPSSLPMVRGAEPVEVVIRPPEPELEPDRTLYLDPEKIRQAAHAVLGAGLEHAEPKVRRAVLEFIRLTGEADWQERLLAALESEPDAEVQAWVAVTLGVLGVKSARATIAQLARKRDGRSERVLRTFFHYALLRLGKKRAARDLRKASGSHDIGVALSASLKLAEVCEPGDKKVIKLLGKLARRESEIVERDRFGGLSILASLSRLNYLPARDALYGHLDSESAEVRLMAARHLAEQGDDRGRDRLFELYSDQTSPLRVLAAAALVALGEYVGVDALLACVRDERSPHRVECNHALGLIGELGHISELEALYGSRDRVVGVTAASAVLFILGLEPRVLRRDSIDWVQAALGTEDWVVRRDATSVAASLPNEQALPLLAQAVADEHREVRLHATRALAGMHTDAAAHTVTTALVAERDPGVKEQQVVALAKIGSPVAADALGELARGSDRLATLAEGARIAVLDESRDQAAIASAIASLERRFARGKRKIRLAVMESAALADNRRVIPVLEQGLLDRVRAIRFAAAEGLAHYRVATENVLDALRGAMSDRSRLAARAHTALVELASAPIPPATPGDPPVVVEYRASEAVTALLDQPTTESRLLAVPTIADLEPVEARTLLPKALADADQRVQLVAIDAVAEFAEEEPHAAVHMLKTVLRDSDGAARAKAKAHLAELIPRTNGVQPDVAFPPEPPPPSFDHDALRLARERALQAHSELQTSRARVDKLAAKVRARTEKRARNGKEVDEMDAQGRTLERAQGELAGRYAQLQVAVEGVKRAAVGAPSVDEAVRGQVAEAEQWRARSEQQLRESGKVATTALTALGAFLAAERDIDKDLCIKGAETAISQGQLSDARRDLECAEAVYRKRSDYNPRLHYAWGFYYDERSQRTKRKKSKLRCLRKAIERYQLFTDNGEGYLVAQVSERQAELEKERQALRSRSRK